MNLTEWLRYLESLPSGLTNSCLDHIKTVAQRLNVLKFSGKIVTVAGTNGKGSTVIFLEAMLLAAGLNIGAYISPHVLNYNERIRLNGQDVDDNTLCHALALVAKAKGDITLSYFAFTTLAALIIFKEQSPDILLLEVGLGGKFDPVNILDADISIITTIDFDHTHILGKSREQIGYSKAGIMRPLQPVVCGKNMPESVYTVANSLKARLYCLDKDFYYIEKNGYWHWYFAQIAIEDLPLPKLPLANAALALMAVKLLAADFDIPTSAIITGLKKAFLIGRLQRLTFADKEIILDVAHNVEASSLLAFNLTHKKQSGHILAVASMLKDKDIVASFKPLVPIIDKWYLGVLGDERAANASQLSGSLQQAGGKNFALFPTITESFKQAIAECGENDRIVVFGSFHTVAEVLNIIIS